MGGVRTSIIGRPRPSPGHRRAHPNYTLNCEEPVLLLATLATVGQQQGQPRFRNRANYRLRMPLIDGGLNL
jgi:hypothetical protein